MGVERINRDDGGARSGQERRVPTEDMATLTELLVRLVESVVDLVIIFATEVATHDPIGLLVFLVGAALTTVAAGLFGVLTVGALGAWVRDAFA
jgi:hypothetical protein